MTMLRFNFKLYRFNLAFRWPILLLVLSLALPAWGAPSPAGQFLQTTPTASGRWITAGHSAVVQIAPCGADLCGRIVGMVLAPGEPVPRDWQGQSQCGLTIIQTAPDAGSGGTSWTGSILDPRDGSVYHAHITLSAGELKLRGYVGLPIFGQTQTWMSYGGHPGPDCRLTP